MTPRTFRKNHHQSDTIARTFRDGPVLSTPTKPTNAASLVHPKVKLLGALLACALRVVRVFTVHAVARSRPANSLIMESRNPLSPSGASRMRYSRVVVVPIAVCELALCKASGQVDATWFVFRLLPHSLCRVLVCVHVRASLLFLATMASLYVAAILFSMPAPALMK